MTKRLSKQNLKQTVRRLVGEPYVGKRLKLRALNHELRALDLGAVRSILDAGSEDATFTYWLADHFPTAKVTGVDVDDQSVAACNAAIPTRYAGRVDFISGLFANLEPTSYDLVTAFDVLEHIQDDASAVADLFKALRPGGCLLVHVPRNTWTHFDGRVEVVADEDAWRINDGHVRMGYSPESLASLLRGAGFDVEAIELWLRRWGVFAFAAYHRVERFPPARLLTIPITDLAEPRGSQATGERRQLRFRDGAATGRRVTQVSPKSRVVELDALRGIAVLAVLLFHTVTWAPSGFLGVDVFFVLSGFLITGLLLGEHRSDRHHPARTLPSAPTASPLPGDGRDGRRCRGRCGGRAGIGRPNLRDALRTLTYTANFSLHGGFLDHMWTLAVEAQFYVVWAAVFFLSWRRGRFLPWLGLATVGLVVLADLLAGRTGAVHTLGRATGLPIGCMLALSPRVVTALSRFAKPALVLLVCVFFVSVSPTLTTSWPLSIGTVLAAPVVAGISRGELGVLAWRPLSVIGRRSYSLYLWHFPIATVAFHHIGSGAPHNARVVLAIVGSLIAAELSYRYVELPALRFHERRAARYQSVGA